ncbi:MAG: hypothetical protein QOE70_163 [Chthoniobacter sp.]|jgi:hypothetical protein|nr:hypothetical protein [Chthoniobacter sp.]
MVPRHFAVLKFLAAGLLAGTGALAGTVDFNRDIQPILSENCYHCHGPDAKARKAKLRLDRKEGALGKNEDGVAIVSPGQPAESELIARIFSTDPDEVMPTPKSNRKLTDAQKQLLKQWVEQGAPWAEHWAFVAPKRPAVPTIADCGLRIADLEKRDATRAAALRQKTPEWSHWPRNAIDNFVLARLLGEGLLPSHQAPPEKLCRRLHLDLTGLPPTPEELDAFLQSAEEAEGTRGGRGLGEPIANPQSAIESLVDRLLASPRYGERMVWEWLDAARYADTNGYQGDPTRAMWYWRDWAIRALNENLPFDQFTIEQLAGDLLPNPTHEQLVATGFHRNHMINGEGGRIAEESRVDYVQDRVETTGTVWMGLTLNCCRCHDHKFDPIKQREYYQLSAYFNSIDETGANDAGGLANPIVSFPSPEQAKRTAELREAELAAALQRDDLEKRLRAEQPSWEEALRAGGSAENPPDPKWQVLVPAELYSDQGTVLTALEDGSIRASGPSPKTDDYSVTIHSQLAGITAIKLEALPDEALINKGPGRSDNGNFVLTEVSLQDGGAPLGLSAVSVDFAQGGFSAQGPFDGDPKTGWAVMPQFGKAHTLLFELSKPTGGGAERVLAFRFSFQFGREHTLGHFRLSATTDHPALLRPIPDSIIKLIARPAAERSADEQKELTKLHLDTSPELIAARKIADEAKKAREGYEKTLPRTMVMRERAKPRDTFILVKGAYDKFGDKVEHGTPAVLPALAADAPKTRLALARWLVSPEHPLTARVTVNRYWQLFFGRGLVKTVDDFGVQGEKPTHPELLDWLACEFVESGWDVKHLIRLIVTSATYQQASGWSAGPPAQPPGWTPADDPENQLLARGPRFRLPSWMLRDQALAVSGLLVEKIGGPPVKVYQPANVWEDATFGQIKFTQDHGEALYRRSLYIFWRRIVGPTLFFDVASRQNCAVKVGRTNTPLHALVTLNDVTYVEAARALAERMLRQGGSGDAERIAYGFRLCTSRIPTAGEQNVLAGSLARFRQQYTSDPEAARKLIATGESKPDGKIAAEELAAQTSLALLLLNLDETLSKE